MESEGISRGLDRPGDGPTRRRRNDLIGIIGRSVLNTEEKAAFIFIGRSIARLGRTLAYIPSKGVADKVREGVEMEGGKTLVLERDVIGTADHTLIYPDQRLLSRLRTSYPNLEAQVDVGIIEERLLPEWLDAVRDVLDEHGLEHPE